MKYMGSKRAMLRNGLGTLLANEMCETRRFVDLFAGSAAVSIYIATRYPVTVLAFDLQMYSAVLAQAVLGRRETVDWRSVWSAWLQSSTKFYNKYTLPNEETLTRGSVNEFREWCEERVELPITRSYGGHYFSPKQAIWLDALRAHLPRNAPGGTVALASLIQAASQCAASPGHTAQPFQPTQTAKKYLREAWKRDVVRRTMASLEAIAGLFARRIGAGAVRDANEVAYSLRDGDLAFIDPPYSGVHYSRFYHVLETIAQGTLGDVSGVGRYPSRENRPRSKYSIVSEAGTALERLLAVVASKGARAILTFPDHECSNGLSGREVREISKKYFRTCERHVDSEFSTLGGTGDERGNEAGRSPRKHAKELMLLLEAK